MLGDNTINKVAEEVISPEELKERQSKIQEMSKEAKKKAPNKVVPVSSTRSRLVEVFFCQGIFLTECKIINFFSLKIWFGFLFLFLI